MRGIDGAPRGVVMHHTLGTKIGYPEAYSPRGVARCLDAPLELEGTLLISQPSAYVRPPALYIWTQMSLELGSSPSGGPQLSEALNNLVPYILLSTAIITKVTGLCQLTQTDEEIVKGLPGLLGAAPESSAFN